MTHRSPPPNCENDWASRNLTIVDVRPLAAYNGWRRNGEARGGHIPGAVAFPAAWLGQRRRSRDRASPRREGDHGGHESSSTATAPTTPPPRGQDRALGHRGVLVLRRRRTGLGRRRDPAGRATAQVRGARPHPRGSATSSPAKRPKPPRPASSCCSTSTSGSPRNTPRATSRARSTSTRTGSRTRPTGTAARPRHRGRPRGARHHPRHDGHPLRPGHRGRRQREVAGSPRRPDRRDPRADDPALRRRRRRPAARRRIRLVGPARATRSRPSTAQPSPVAVVRRARSRCGPRSSSTSTRPRRSSRTPTAPPS